jgi:hypothetical protein
MACLAKEANVPWVVYNGIYPECCDDARVSAKRLGCLADDYVRGDIQDLSEKLVAKKLKCCALASISVIEHIYNFEEFLQLAAPIF